jgi:hypothetical protein
MERRWRCMPRVCNIRGPDRKTHDRAIWREERYLTNFELTLKNWNWKRYLTTQYCAHFHSSTHSSFTTPPPPSLLRLDSMSMTMTMTMLCRY